mgnify:CR=1 FL=1
MAGALLGGIAIGPESVEGIGRVDGASRVIVVTWTVLGDLLFELPSRALIAADVFHYFAAALVGLWSGRAGHDHRPNVTFEVEATRIVVVIGGAYF